MRKLWLLMLAWLLCGCAHQYVMKLTNGLQVTTSNKPKLKGAYYYYKGPHRETQSVAQSRVLEIEPASMAKQESQFHPSEPKKKHWYWPF